MSTYYVCYKEQGPYTMGATERDVHILQVLWRAMSMLHGCYREPRPYTVGATESNAHILWVLQRATPMCRHCKQHHHPQLHILFLLANYTEHQTLINSGRAAPRGFPSIPSARRSTPPGRAACPHREITPGSRLPPENLQTTFFLQLPSSHPRPGLCVQSGCCRLPASPAAASCLHSHRRHSEDSPSLSHFYINFLSSALLQKKQFSPSPALALTALIRSGARPLRRLRQQPANGLTAPRLPGLITRSFARMSPPSSPARGFLGAHLTRQGFGPVFVHVLRQIAPSGDKSTVEGGGWMLINASADAACSCLCHEKALLRSPGFLESSAL